VSKLFFITLLVIFLLVLFALWQFDVVHVTVSTQVVDLTLDAQRHVQQTPTPDVPP